MKRILISMVVALIATLSITSCAQQRMLAPLKGDKNIELVYVSKAMMNLAKGMATHQIGVQASMYAHQIKNVSCVEVASSENPQGAQRISDLTDKLVKDYKLELLVEAEENDEVNCIYGLTNSKGTGFSLMLIFSKEKKESNLVVIQGDFMQK